MRKKLLSKTYLRDVNKYILTLDFTNEDYYLSKKKIIYAIRVYFDNNKNILEYYIDITNGCGIDDESKVPYYDDLYLDITITNGQVEVLDQDELENAFSNKLIDINTYNKAVKTKDKLLEEIKNNCNKYLKMDMKELLDEI